MQLNTPFIRRIALIVAIPTLVVLLAPNWTDKVFQGIVAPSSGVADQSTLSNPVAKNVRAALPIRLKIPKLSIDASIEDVGLAADGSMAVPAGPDDVAWFAPGPRPGEIGSAVIAGHEGWKDGRSAVFDYLHTLHVGDKLYVEDAKGVTTAFVVRELRTFGDHDDASTVFSSDDGKAHLNLVTCKGVWDKTLKSYSDRLVVFADEVNNE